MKKKGSEWAVIARSLSTSSPGRLSLALAPSTSRLPTCDAGPRTRLNQEPITYRLLSKTRRFRAFATKATNQQREQSLFLSFLSSHLSHCESDLLYFGEINVPNQEPITSNRLLAEHKEFLKSQITKFLWRLKKHFSIPTRSGGGGGGTQRVWRLKN